jgi:hypothetical protein
VLPQRDEDRFEAEATAAHLTGGYDHTAPVDDTAASSYADSSSYTSELTTVSTIFSASSPAVEIFNTDEAATQAATESPPVVDGADTLADHASDAAALLLAINNAGKQRRLVDLEAFVEELENDFQHKLELKGGLFAEEAAEDEYYDSLEIEDVHEEKEKCATGLGGGTVFGTKCVFPFTFKGHNVTECTDLDNGDLEWCATAVDEEQNYIRGMWGECVEMHHCPVQNSTDAETNYYYEDENAEAGLTDPHAVVVYPSLSHSGGVNLCYDECDYIKGCNFYAFSADLMMCMLLGDATIHGITAGCTLMTAFSSGNEKIVHTLKELVRNE